MGRRAKPAKVKAQAKRPAVRKAPKKNPARVRELEKRLAEALDQQTATNEILRVISSTQTDLGPVFDTIVRNAARVCDAVDAVLELVDGAETVRAAHCGPIEGRPLGARMPLTRGTFTGRAILDTRAVHVEDVTVAPDFPQGQELMGRFGCRTALAVPLLRESRGIGSLLIRRVEVRPFSDKQIAMLQTFADQAVIAIENVRLFTELEASNRELTTALDTQTATSDILRVISRSQTDVQPVFDAIVASAVRLLGAHTGLLTQVAGDQIELAALTTSDAAGDAAVRASFPTPLHAEGANAGAIRDRAPLNIADTETDPRVSEALRAIARARGYRSLAGVPLLRHDVAVGSIAVTRRAPGGFTDDEIELLKTFADQAVIAIENARLLSQLQASNRELTEALDTQTATSDILRVISQSQTDVQPVFDAIVASAVRLLGAYSGVLTRIVGDQIGLAALTSTDDAGDAALRATFPRSLHSEEAHAKAMRDRTPVNIADTETDPRRPEAVRAAARARGYRSAVVVPLLRHDEAIGAIAVNRREPGGFTDDEIALLQTFADQAVIAIENARLLSELQEKNEALTQAHAQVSETLEQQMATSEILRVISSSPTDAQPVFDAIVKNARRLLHAAGAVAFRRIGDEIQLAALTIHDEARAEALTSGYPVPFSQMVRDNPLSTRAWVNGEVGNIPDAVSDPRWPERLREPVHAFGVHGLLIVPMRRDDLVLGVITVMRHERGLFSNDEIELLKTFADQAVIAVENVRLFTELQASNRELTSALDTQTATSDILRVISRSQTDVQPVFDAILASAVRLLGASSGALTRIAGDQIALAALTSTDDAGDAALRAFYPRSLQSEGPHPQAIRDRVPLNIADAHTDPRLPEAVRANAPVRGYRSMAAVPLLRHDTAIGSLGVSRREPGGFTDDEIALLQTFADQAVIAIENARLLSELQARTQELTRSVEQLTALGEVGRAVSSTLDLETVLTTIVSRAVQLSGLDGGVVLEYDEGAEEFVQRAQAETGGALAAVRRATRIRKGEGVIGRTATTLEPTQVSDITVPGAYMGPNRENLIESGIRAILAVPMVREERLIGCLGVTRNRPGEFPTETIELLRTFATQSALAIQNARLFREIEIKSRELEVASQHKSEFLASMSHELRTPLNAIIGFSDVLLQGMFGETNEKQTDYLRDILASGQHLLSLINDILDLSKIEAGRMELDLADFHLPSAIDDALLLMRERAGRRGITLERHVGERVGEIHADQRKVKQVLLNLLSNAVKFTPEGGRIDVRAALANGTAEISVTDTGVGIAREDHEAVFEEFRQVGASDKKAEGTGLGLALCRKFVELHGGRIWVKSQIGAGSTFTFTLPLRQ